MRGRPFRFVSALLFLLLAAGGSVRAEVTASQCAVEGKSLVAFRPDGPGSKTMGVCAELAVTPEQLTRGLMDRDGLAADRGMLFILEKADSGAFWMKNVRFALDVVLISEDFSVAALWHDVPSCGRDLCPVYRFPVAAKYMLEVGAGWLARHAVTIGTPVKIQHPGRWALP